MKFILYFKTNFKKFKLKMDDESLDTEEIER